MLQLEIFVGILVTAIFLACAILASYVPMAAWARACLILAGLVPFFIGVAYTIRIEQIAGYYECRHCHRRQVPGYSQTLFAMHYGRTRYMKCPACGKRSWQRKTLSKE